MGNHKRQRSASLNSLFPDRIVSRNRALSVQNPRSTRRNPVQVTYLEFYGFALYLISFVVFLAFILWAYLPDSFWERFGITYHIDRHWAISLPAYFVFMWLIYSMLLVSIMFMRTEDPSSIYQITDEKAVIKDNECLDDLHDIPISEINFFIFEKTKDP